LAQLLDLDPKMPNNPQEKNWSSKRIPTSYGTSINKKTIIPRIL
jgi:hypothetical protein